MLQFFVSVTEGGLSDTLVQRGSPLAMVVMVVVVEVVVVLGRVGPRALVS